MKYQVIKSYDLDMFTAFVNSALADGWRLVGGVAVSTPEAQRVLYAQALVKDRQ